MTTILQTIETLGKPVFIADLGVVEQTHLVLARWRHGDAAISTASADAARVLLSLGGVQNVSHVQPDRIVKATGAAGDVGILPAGLPTETTISGRADIVQIFLEPGDMSSVQSAWIRQGALLAAESEALRALTVRLFVAAHARDQRMVEDSAKGLIDLVRQSLLHARADRKRQHAGGLPPSIMRGLDGLIAARASKPGFARINVKEFADRAKLSVGHLIRAFRQTTGITPYQYVMTLRRKMALGLLTEPQVSIADVAELIGCSSPAHFSAAFRGRFGVRPSDYRAAVLDVDQGFDGA